MSLAIFFILWKLRHRFTVPGTIWFTWMALAGVERFIVEIFRAKDDRFVAGLTVAQIISLLITAIQSTDTPVVMAITFVYAMLVVVFNLVADIIYGVLDPRITYT